ncbi:type II toxin-antitoxin system VapC family toxin [Pendulispora albinea]|uniref:Type II toxin-antitoxin system VapC family toxin n=1 Tax=Pendulispora albinea TaxID=2741071 RepID=A0ABZ2M9R6_9BACT
MIVLDTHTLVWFLLGNPQLGKGATRIIDRNIGRSALVSAISFCEIAALAKRGRVALEITARDFRDHAMNVGFIEKPVDGVIAIEAVALAFAHRDPADRLIVATACSLGAALMTADQVLLDAGVVQTVDARL